METLSSSDAVDYQSHQACVVYDSRTGVVLHIHEVLVLDPAESHTREEIETSALNLAAKDSAQRSLLRVLHVRPEDLLPHRSFKVDVERLTLIAEPSRE